MKTAEELAQKYEDDFKEEVQNAWDDSKQWMVPRDEPYYHFLAGWKACQDEVEAAQSAKIKSDHELHLEACLTTARAARKAAFPSDRESHLAYSIATSSHTNVEYISGHGWRKKV